MRFDPAVLAVDPDRRAVVLEVLAAAVGAVDPAVSVRRAVRREAGRLVVDGRHIDLPPSPITVLGIGKAAPAMARGLAAAAGGHPLCGAVATSTPGPVPEGVEILPGGHPIPSSRSVAAGRRLLELAAGAAASDLVVALVSGGGSACAEVPSDGISLDDLAAVNRILLTSGAPIQEINVLRKHLSDLKGGRLAAAVHPARLVTLILSDVVGNRLDAIASGPTVPDPSTFSDALAVVERRSLGLPSSVMRRLTAGRSGMIAETPDAGAPFDTATTVIVGDAAVAAEGARRAADRLGIEARVVSHTVAGEARVVGASLAAAGRRLDGPGMLVYAGETTVTVHGAGTGGRNQEVALGAGLALSGESAVVVAALGTDGIDGPTPYAGALADGSTVERGRRAGRDAGAALAANDSSPYLRATGDLLICGPTGTNVGDVMIVYRSEAAPERSARPPRRRSPR